MRSQGGSRPRGRECEKLFYDFLLELNSAHILHPVQYRIKLTREGGYNIEGMQKLNPEIF